MKRNSLIFFSLLLSILLIANLCGNAQTRISTSQIQDGAVTPAKMSSDAKRPPSAVLEFTELTFDLPHKVFTHTITADTPITLAASGNIAHSRIDLIVTGDGIHTMTFPSNWTMKGDAFNINSIQEIQLRYNGVGIIGEIITQTAIDVLTAALTAAIITREANTELTLLFNEPMNVTVDGWSVSASAAGVTIGSVSGSGTTNIVFTLSRSILDTETITVSYSATTGESADIGGNLLASITNFSVTPPEPAPPTTQNCDRTVCASGCDHTTITAANAAAAPGDVICIGTGTYRETITVADNDVTFTNVTGEVATISGFEDVGTTGWTVHSGNIYKKTITLPVTGYNTSTTVDQIYPGNTNIFANQILRNGDMMPEARWPNLPATAGIVSFVDFMKWENYRQLNYSAGFGTTGLTDATLPVSSGLTGAVLVSNGWFATEARTVTQTGATTLTYGAIWGSSGTAQWPRKAYYLTGKLPLLNAEGEWHYEGGILYFWQPGGGTPSGSIVHKARNWGFDIRGKQGVKIIGLNFIGVDPVIGDASSTNALVEKTTATFNNHHVRLDVLLWNGGIYVGMPRLFGTKLLGANSVFKDNVWSKFATAGVWLGPNCRAENNLMEYIGYAGGSGCPISFWDRDDNQIVTRNTLRHLGRSGIDFGYVYNGEHLNVEISYNDIYNYGMISSDGGATYAAGQTNLIGLNYHHNWMHDNLARTIIGEGGLNAGGYFDQATGGGTIHHNVFWGNPGADFYHETTNPTRSTGTLFNIYNNTLAGTYLVEGNESSYRSYVTTPQDVQRNNIYRRDMVVGWPQAQIKGNTSFSLGSGTNPVFVGTGTSGLVYRIQTGSPAKDAGTSIAGITDGSVGVPDIGAYEFGGEDWVPGYTSPVDDGTVNDDEFTYSLNWLENNNALQIFNQQDVHYTLTVGSTATYIFNTTNATLYVESCDNHSVGRFEILNAGNTVIATQDINMFAETGSGTCDAGVRTSVNFTGLAAGQKTARVTLFSIDNSQTPPRNSLVFDGGRFFN